MIGTYLTSPCMSYVRESSEGVVSFSTLHLNSFLAVICTSAMDTWGTKPQPLMVNGVASTPLARSLSLALLSEAVSVIMDCMQAQCARTQTCVFGAAGQVRQGFIVVLSLQQDTQLLCHWYVGMVLSTATRWAALLC